MGHKFISDTALSKQPVWSENQFCVFNLGPLLLCTTFQREKSIQKWGVKFLVSLSEKPPAIFLNICLTLFKFIHPFEKAPSKFMKQFHCIAGIEEIRTEFFFIVFHRRKGHFQASWLYKYDLSQVSFIRVDSKIKDQVFRVCGNVEGICVKLLCTRYVGGWWLIFTPGYSCQMQLWYVLLVSVF